jgi:hypothetical protein
VLSCALDGLDAKGILEHTDERVKDIIWFTLDKMQHYDSIRIDWRISERKKFAFYLSLSKQQSFFIANNKVRMTLYHDIPAGPKIPDVINVIVEIPKGSQNKYEYDKKTDMIRLDRVLFSPIFYVGDYGMIPQTLSEDGDPLDVLVLVTNPTYPGILIEARPALLRAPNNG